MKQLSEIIKYLRNDVYIDQALLSNIILTMISFEDYLVEWSVGDELLIDYVALTPDERVIRLFFLLRNRSSTTRSSFITRFDNAATISEYNGDTTQLLSYVGQFYDMFNITLNQKINL